MQNGIRALVLAVVGGCASATWAGFTLTATKFSVVVNGTPLDRYDINVVNTGGDTGTQVKGMEYFFTGSRVFFQVADETDATGEGDPDHIPDTVNFNSNSLSRIRLNNVGSSNVFVGTSPDKGPAQWNPYMVGRKQFSGAVANTGNTQATGAGYQIARFFTLQGGGGSFSGNLGGDIGSKVPFSMYAGPIAGGSPAAGPESNNLDEPVVAIFGSDVAAGAPFSLTLNYTLANPANPYSLSTTPIPGIRDVLVSSTITGNNQEILITGKVDYSRLYNPTIVPFTLSGGFGFPTDSFVVFAMPEPGSALLLGAIGCAVRRRRP